MYDDKSIILGIKIGILKYSDVLDWCKQALEGNETKILCTPNPEIILKAYQNSNYRKILNQTDYAIADGIGLQIASGILGNKIPPRITGVDLMDSLCAMAELFNYKVGLLGGEKGTINKTKTELLKKYPNLNITFIDEGPMPGEINYDTFDLINRINKNNVELLFVAFGAPRQETWLIKNKDKLTTLKLGIGVGGCFDFIAGKIPRAPKLVRQFGLEWLYRLMQQPQQRWRRIWNATVEFMIVVLKTRWRIWFKYRPDTMAFIVNKDKKILLCHAARYTYDVWQLPQGGVDAGETAAQAIIREIKEEVGLNNLEIIIKLPNFNKYIAPPWAQRIIGYKGQVQDLFILKHNDPNQSVQLDNYEFDQYQWLTPSEALNLIDNNRCEQLNKTINIAQKNGLL